MTDSKERDRKKRKKKFKRKLRNKALAVLGPLWIKFWIGSVRYRVHTPINVHPFHENETPQIYAFWHQRMLAFVLSHRKSGVRILISSHGDFTTLKVNIDVIYSCN